MKTALLLIDLQNDYFPGGNAELVNPLPAVANANKILSYFRDHALPVFHIQHYATRPGATFFIPGTAGAAIHPLVAPMPDEQIIIKNFPNSFRDTPLLQALQAVSVERLVVCGMMTHMCVDATVRAAKDFGFSCTVLEDACATKSLQHTSGSIPAEYVHHAFIAALGYFYADIQTTEAFLNNC